MFAILKLRLEKKVQTIVDKNLEPPDSKMAFYEDFANISSPRAPLKQC